MADPRGSILVVDDEPAMRLLLSSVLKEEGHDVSAAASGEEALQFIAKRHYHLVLTDLKMPGISGLDLLEQVRRDDPDTAVIILTAFGTVEGAVEAVRKGAVHYLLKPLANPDELRLAVRRVLEERRVTDEAASLRQATEAVFPFGEIVAGDGKMQAALELGRSVAPTDAPYNGRDGNGKGADGAGHPSLESAGRAVLRRRELRCFGRVPAGERAVRSRERVLHRGPEPAAGALRAGAWRYPLP